MHIQVLNLSKAYLGTDVLKNISFTLSEGERVALVGKNGSGKSTLFKILMNQEQPDEGKIIFSPKDLRLGYLPQIQNDTNNLSSGQKLKKKLQEVLAVNPDILLLDEPTNHLDLPGMLWLEHEVSIFPGPVLLVSHDRHFLDKVVTKILELEDDELRTYGGNYTFYKEQHRLQAEANARKYFDQRKRLGKLEDRANDMKTRTQRLELTTTGTDHYVRRKAAKSASSALSMEKRIQKELTETTITKPEPDWNLKALFKPSLESNQTVVNVKDVSYKHVFKHLTLLIHQGDRVALLGDNGSGKTTLVKIILDQLKPDSGEVMLGNNVKIGYLSQEHQELDSDRLVLDELISDRIDKSESYKLLRRFLLTPEKINQAVKSLSSGEKAKLLLAKIMTSGANFIILDEPTNHLDIPSREAIENALASYSGTFLIISHDRYFLNAIGITKKYCVLNQAVTEVI